MSTTTSSPYRHPTGRLAVLLKREFTLPKLTPGMRAFIHFEAIAYYGRVDLNGAVLGAMGPYTPYEFEFTPHAKEERIQFRSTWHLVPFADGSGSARSRSA